MNVTCHIHSLIGLGIILSVWSCCRPTWKWMLCTKCLPYNFKATQMPLPLMVFFCFLFGFFLFFSNYELLFFIFYFLERNKFNIKERILRNSNIPTI
jgi:hypothetical protein